jgi:hypothetical protein
MREATAAVGKFLVVLVGACLALISALSILGAIAAVIIWPFGGMLAWGGVMFFASYFFIAAGLSLTTASGLLRRILLAAVCFMVGSNIVIEGLRSGHLSISFVATTFSLVDFTVGAVVGFGSGVLLGL